MRRTSRCRRRAGRNLATGCYTAASPPLRAGRMHLANPSCTVRCTLPVAPLAELQPGLPRSPRLELWLLLPFIHCDWALRSTGRTMVPPAARLLDSFWRGSDRGNRIAPPLAGHRPVPRHAGGAAFHWFGTHPPCRRSTRSISRRTKRWPSSAGWSRGTGSTSWPATTASSGSDSSAGRRAGRIPARTRP